MPGKESKMRQKNGEKWKGEGVREKKKWDLYERKLSAVFPASYDGTCDGSHPVISNVCLPIF